jgi:hypothetical protein
MVSSVAQSKASPALTWLLPLLVRRLQALKELGVRPLEALLKGGGHCIGDQAGRGCQAGHVQRLANVEAFQGKEVEDE